MRVYPPLKIEKIFFAFLDELDHSTHFQKCMEIDLGVPLLINDTLVVLLHISSRQRSYSYVLLTGDRRLAGTRVWLNWQVGNMVTPL